MCVKMWTCTADTDGERASKCNFVIFCVHRSLDAGDLDLYVPGVRIPSISNIIPLDRFESWNIFWNIFFFEGRGEEGDHYERFRKKLDKLLFRYNSKIRIVRSILSLLDKRNEVPIFLIYPVNLRSLGVQTREVLLTLFRLEYIVPQWRNLYLRYCETTSEKLFLKLLSKPGQSKINT